MSRPFELYPKKKRFCLPDGFPKSKWVRKWWPTSRSGCCVLSSQIQPVPRYNAITTRATVGTARRAISTLLGGSSTQNPPEPGTPSHRAPTTRAARWRGGWCKGSLHLYNLFFRGFFNGAFHRLNPPQKSFSTSFTSSQKRHKCVYQCLVSSFEIKLWIFLKMY